MKTYAVLTEQYTIRTGILDDREHIIVPVIMMVEGVHHGSHGPILHLAEDLGRYPASWDGIPVTISHPEVDGIHVSANSPEILHQFAVGRIFNTHMDGDKLKAEAWIDIQKLAALSPLALAAIQSSSPLDVSIGVFTDEEEQEGIHNNEQFESIARNHRPDHLALLPGEQGACSWSDGCGVRVNKSNLKTNANEDMKDDEIKAKKDLIRNGHVVAINVNEDGYRALVQKAQSKLDSMDNDQAVYFLEELYDNDLIYRVGTRGQGNEMLYRQSYSISSAGDIEFNGERTRVRKNVEYIQANKMIRKDMADNKKPCCPDKVDALIANAASNFTEDDKEWLLGQTPEILAKLSPKEPKEVETNVSQEIDLSDYVQKGSVDKMEDLIPLVNAELANEIEVGLNLYKEKRANLISQIQDNTQEWTEVELSDMSDSMLEKLSKSVVAVAPGDYSGLGAGSNGQEDTELLLLASHENA